MIPVFKLLSKIKWDKNLNPADYLIYYLDRISNILKEIHFTQIKEFDSYFMKIEKDNKEVNIPLHRIREVKSKGKIIWKR